MQCKEALLNGWKNLLFPRRCIFCGKLLPLFDGTGVCTHCFQELPFSLAYCRCTACGRPVEKGKVYCRHCFGRNDLGYDGVSAAYLYRGKVRQALLRFKRERYQNYALVFAEHMAVLLQYDRSGMTFDLVVSVPPRPKRMQKEGYDQAKCLARRLAKRMGIPYLAKVMKQKEKREKQSSLSMEERFANVSGNFQVIRPDAVCGKRILLVDDIFTTGATLGECAKTLRSAGAKQVYGAVAATVSEA